MVTVARRVAASLCDQPTVTAPPFSPITLRVLRARQILPVAFFYTTQPLSWSSGSVATLHRMLVFVSVADPKFSANPDRYTGLVNCTSRSMEHLGRFAMVLTTVAVG